MKTGDMVQPRPHYVSVAVGLWLDQLFDYSIPSEMEALPQVGARVLVPFGPRKRTGYVLELKEKTDYKGTTKSILEVLDSRPTFNPPLIDLLTWAARYYHLPLGELMRKALPPSLHAAEKVRIEITEKGLQQPQRHELLTRLQQSHNGLAEATVKKLATPAQLKELIDEGLVRRVSLVERGAGQERFTDLVSLKLVDPNLIRGPKQKAIVRHLSKHGDTSTDELKNLFGQVRSTIKTLEQKGLVTLEKTRVYRTIAAEPPPADKQVTLTPGQVGAVDSLFQSLDSRQYSPFLLHGVTGSGKTEVYMRAIERVLAQGRSALILVPEIALTPQLMGTFTARFDRSIAILHSALGPGERLDQWCQVAEGKLPIVLGARSAIFAPLDNLGLIIVDEEHETSFKQDERPFYNARDLALVRGQQANATVVLGSATPSLESYHNARSGKIGYLHLPDRATRRRLPDVLLVDLKQQRFVDERRVLSAPLADAIKENLEAGHQTILFLNRKGFSAFLLCERCGHVPQCPHCSISLTHYKNVRRMRCHYCQFEKAVPDECEVCGSDEVKQVGVGTERVVEAIEEFLPQARVARLDSGVSGAKKLPRVLQRFREGELDILVGTQIVAKGHDFPNVTLVGVILADVGLSFPDLRASERTFQLLTQVAGRAGRGEQAGRVIVQTYIPTHPSLVHAQMHDFVGFAADELEDRAARHYPPYAALALYRFSGEDRDAVAQCAGIARDVLTTLSRTRFPGTDVLGPTMAPLSVVRNRLRMQVLVKAPGRGAMQAMLKAALPELWGRLKGHASVRWEVDVDPVNMM